MFVIYVDITFACVSVSYIDSMSLLWCCYSSYRNIIEYSSAQKQYNMLMDLWNIRFYPSMKYLMCSYYNVSISMITHIIFCVINVPHPTGNPYVNITSDFFLVTTLVDTLSVSAVTLLSEEGVQCVPDLDDVTVTAEALEINLTIIGVTNTTPYETYVYTCRTYA